MRGSSVGYALVAAAAIGWGCWPLVLHDAPMSPALQSAIMMTVLTIGSFPVMLRDRIATRAGGPKVPRRAWLGIVVLGVADALNTILFFSAYQRTTVAIAVLTHYLTPIFIALAAPLLLHERVQPRTKAAVAVSFAGLFLLLAPWRSSLSAADLVGAAFGAGSAVFYATNVIAQKRLHGIFSGAEMVFFHGLIGTPLLWALVPRDAYGSASTHALAVVLAGSIVIGTFGGLAFTWGLKRIHASRASVLTLLEPFVAVMTAALFLGQRLGAVSVVGGVLILGGAGVVVVQSDSRDRP